MTGILVEIGKRVSSRWLTTVLLPGLLLVTVATVGIGLGHLHALDVARLAADVDEFTASARDRPTRITVDVVLALLTAGIAGTAAGGVGCAIERLWLRTRSSLQGDRRRRMLKTTERDGVAPVEAYLPQRFTWMSDRIRLIDARVRAQYWFSATAAWPRIWLLVGEDVRRPLVDARSRFGEAVTLSGWAMLYLLVGLFWWPAFIAGGCVFLTAWWRARSSLDEFATLVEAVIDVHHRTLADALGIRLGTGTITELEGRMIDDVLRKGG